VLLLGFTARAAAIAAGVCGLERSRRLSAALLRLQDSSAQIRVRGAFLLLAAVLALAGRLGLEVLLVAFTAGAVLGLVDRDTMRTHPQLRTKLEGAGFGFFIPVFMVASGLQFDLDALLAGPRTLALAPIALVAIVLVRAVPAAVVHRRALGARAAAASGLLLATSLPFIVAATQIGVAVGALSRGTSAALIAAGVLSLTIMPPAARMLLPGGASRGAAPALRRPVPTTPPTGG
jgi:Kef-type K+ transport system membrane component KefB